MTSPLSHTKYVFIELSNQCSMAKTHQRCPAHYQCGNPVTLPMKIVHNVINLLWQHNYQGQIAFHNYNEPLEDLRLLGFIKYTHTMCPDSDIHITTNGRILDQTLLNELEYIGVTSMLVSTYNDAEYLRLIKLQTGIKYVVKKVKLDNRLRLYNRRPLPGGYTKPCYAPLRHLTITSKGLVTLCCFDWRNHHVFGNLLSDSLDRVLQNEYLHQIYKQLSSGDRQFLICQKCRTSR